MDFNPFLQEWLAIQNIGTKPFGTKYRVPIEGDEPCTYTEEEERKRKSYPMLCQEKLDGNTCREYFSKSQAKTLCVSKITIKTFTSGHTISGKNGEEYEIIDSVEPITLNISKTNGRQVELYCLLFSSKTAGNLYVLFPTGLIFEDETIFQGEIMTHFLDSIYTKLFELLAPIQESGKKIVLCGHSMGCVLAIHLALKIQERNQEEFMNHFIVMGSAPYRCLHPERAVSFQHLPNVFIFVAGLYIPSKDGNGKKMLLDKYVNAPEYSMPGLKNYTPMMKVAFEGGDEVSTLYTDDAVFSQVYEGNIGFTADQLSPYMHKWETYYELLSSTAPYEEVVSKMASEGEEPRETQPGGKKKRSSRRGRKSRRSRRTRRSRRSRRQRYKN